MDILRRYRIWVINTDQEAHLYKWDNWKLFIPSIDKLLTLTKQKAFIRTFQSFEFENKWLGFGRMTWCEESNLKWTAKYRTPENELRLKFYGTEIWAPDWNEVYRSGMPPDLYIKLYNFNFNSIKEGIIIASPRQLTMKHKDMVDSEIERLRSLIPNSTLTMTTRFWTPWFRFDNRVEDMNAHELEKIIKNGKA